MTSPAAYAHPTTSDWASGSVLLLPADVRRAVEPWDERYFLYSEETDVLLRAGDLGHRVRLVPQARCRHLLGDAHTSPRLWALLSVNRVRLFRRRHGAAQTAAFRTALVVGSALRAAGDRDGTHRAALRALLTPARRWGGIVRAAGGTRTP